MGDIQIISGWGPHFSRTLGLQCVYRSEMRADGLDDGEIKCSRRGKVYEHVRGSLPLFPFFPFFGIELGMGMLVVIESSGFFGFFFLFKILDGVKSSPGVHDV